MLFENDGGGFAVISNKFRNTSKNPFIYLGKLYMLVPQKAKKKKKRMTVDRWEAKLLVTIKLRLNNKTSGTTMARTQRFLGIKKNSAIGASLSCVDGGQKDCGTI